MPHPGPDRPVKLVIVIGCIVTALQFAAFGRHDLTGPAARAEGQSDHHAGLD